MGLATDPLIPPRSLIELSGNQFGIEESSQLDRIEKVVSLIELRCDARCGKRESQYGELGLAKNEDWYRYRDLLVRFFMYEGMI